MARSALLGGLKRSLSPRSFTLACVVSSFSILAAHGANLSREDILRQHQQLERQHDDPGVSSDQQDGLAPPLAPSSSDSGSSDNSSAGDSDDSGSAGGSVAAGSSGSLTARLLQRVNSLESQVREMRGELDQLTNQMQQSQADMAKQIGDMQFAQQNHGSAHAAGAASPGALASSASAAEDSSPKPSVTPVKSGQEALKAKRYGDAEYYARAALKAGKSKPVKVEANFLLAQAMAGQKNYRQSAVSYFDAYRTDPSSSRAPEALLGVAASMISLQNKPAACEALNKLNSEFPDANARVKSSAKVFRARAACH
ncbi:hypothetical protein PT277_02635 [Acetobacteraceae bacterium ESL0709]|nr:hypothetical protein [Acetobacteraceae bacterium ESL0697]MDF7677599.1 hypothetical protein [Acetobacteraceae bacterium ESL0709]